MFLRDIHLSLVVCHLFFSAPILVTCLLAVISTLIKTVCLIILLIRLLGILRGVSTAARLGVACSLHKEARLLLPKAVKYPLFLLSL